MLNIYFTASITDKFNSKIEDTTRAARVTYDDNILGLLDLRDE